MAKAKRVEDLLREISDSLRDLSTRMGRLELKSAADVAVSRPRFVPGTLSSLPEHLRRSMETIVTIGQGTAELIAEKTGRSRAAESDYLNQLVDRGFLKKERVGKEVVFQVFDVHTVCPMCGNRVPINVRFCNACGVSLRGEVSVLAGNKDG
jgi:hypothetical protein